MSTVNYPLHLMCSYLNRKVYHHKNNVMLHKYKDKNILVFRGTNDTKSLTYSFHLWENEQIHEGYKRYSMQCKELVEDLGLDTKTPLVITGHSIGSIAGALIAHELDFQAELVLFGSPKLAKASFREEISRNKKLTIYNYINKHDIIAAYPFIYYEHICEPIILENAKKSVNPLAYHSMKTYSQNIYRKKNMTERKGIHNPFDEYLDIL